MVHMVSPAMIAASRSTPEAWSERNECRKPLDSSRSLQRPCSTNHCTAPPKRRPCRLIASLIEVAAGGSDASRSPPRSKEPTCEADAIAASTPLSLTSDGAPGVRAIPCAADASAAPARASAHTPDTTACAEPPLHAPAAVCDCVEAGEVADATGATEPASPLSETSSVATTDGVEVASGPPLLRLRLGLDKRLVGSQSFTSCSATLRILRDEGSCSAKSSVVSLCENIWNTCNRTSTGDGSGALCLNGAGSLTGPLMLTLAGRVSAAKAASSYSAANAARSRVSKSTSPTSCSATDICSSDSASACGRTAVVSAANNSCSLGMRASLSSSSISIGGEGSFRLDGSGSLAMPFVLRQFLLGRVNAAKDAASYCAANASSSC